MLTVTCPVPEVEYESDPRVLRLAMAHRPSPAVVALDLDSRSYASVSSLLVSIARVVSPEHVAETVIVITKKSRSRLRRESRSLVDLCLGNFGGGGK